MLHESQKAKITMWQIKRHDIKGDLIMDKQKVLRWIDEVLKTDGWIAEKKDHYDTIWLTKFRDEMASGRFDLQVSQKTAGIIDDEIEHDEEEYDYFDAEDYEEKRFEKECEYAASCTCGAWQFNKNNKPVHVADCICGNGL